MLQLDTSKSAYVNHLLTQMNSNFHSLEHMDFSQLEYANDKMIIVKKIIYPYQEKSVCKIYKLTSTGILDIENLQLFCI